MTASTIAAPPRIPPRYYAVSAMVWALLASVFTPQLTILVLPGTILGVLLVTGIVWWVLRHEPRPVIASAYAREWKTVLGVGFVSLFVPVLVLSVVFLGRPIPLALCYAFSMSIPAFFVGGFFHPRLWMNRRA